MESSQIAAQLYTLRDYLKTPKEVAASLHKVRAIGYEAVQLSGLCKIDESELLSILNGEGLTCNSTHEDDILSNPEGAAERLNKLGCKYTAYPYPAGIKMDSLDDILAFAAQLDKSGKVLRDAGIVLTYHNHHIEFRRFGGRLMLDIIYQETSPEHLQAELDTHWVQAGGCNPVEWCERMSGRLPLLHLKDYGIKSDNTPGFFEVGNGNLDWKKIISAAERSGCKSFIVEQDSCPGDPFDSLKMSLDYLKANICEK